MADKLVNKILGIFSGLATLAYGKELLIFIISLLPILELRGGLIAAALLGVNPVPAYIISIIGNIIPVYFIVKYIILVSFGANTAKLAFWKNLNEYLSVSLVEGFSFSEE